MCGTMRALVAVSVLLALALTLTCASVPTRDSSGRRWTCDESENEPGAKLAMISINNNHFHGYKFQLSKINSGTVEKGESDCKLHLELDLQETTCHNINPTPFQECEVRTHSETQVKAQCNVTLTITEGNSTEVSKHSCNTEPVSAEELIRMCPECPVLLPLHSPEGLESVKAGLIKFNMDHNYTSYFKLMEVGRITSAYIMRTGMIYKAEFAVVETNCNARSKIETQACMPLCRNDTRYGFCISTLDPNGEVDIDCTIYEALNTSSIHIRGRKCHLGHRFFPWLHRPLPGQPGLPPGFPGQPGPPLYLPGPGSHGESRPSGHEFPFPHCHGFVKIPPSIHPLCPFPPRHHHRPHGHGPPPGHSPPPHPPHGTGQGPPPGHSPPPHPPHGTGQGPPPGHSPPPHPPHGPGQGPPSGHPPPPHPPHGMGQGPPPRGHV
uniref:Cystatin domain-containing protein n=1 Tax=Esox lucius TaxID=8010 RepID=A0A3P9ADZ8_ESOLU